MGEGPVCHHLLTVKDTRGLASSPWDLVLLIFTLNSIPLLLLSGNSFHVCVPIVPCSLNICPYIQKDLYSRQGLVMVMPYHSLAQHLTQRRPETEACRPQGLLDIGIGDMFGDSGGVQVTMC